MATLSIDQSNCSPGFLNYHLTLKMASVQVLEASVTNNSPSQDSNHPDDLFQSRKIVNDTFYGIICFEIFFINNIERNFAWSIWNGHRSTPEKRWEIGALRNYLETKWRSPARKQPSLHFLEPWEQNVRSENNKMI